MKTNKSIQFILLVIVVIIWAGVFSRTYHVIKKDKKEIKINKEPASRNETLLKEKLKKLEIDFNKTRITDPFRSFSDNKASGQNQGKESKNSLIINAPAYLLQGIVWDTAHPKAVIVKSRIYKEEGSMKIGETRIVEKDSLIDYGKVLDISENYVIITTYNVKFRLKSDIWEKTE